ncbi:MAG TPA: 2-C-methyl-D-erythritol 2,4-cyclodiphosphate synthase [Actinomycetota bacterium]|nr:2-C-methyl-D-erythritol 2,4-cyclodiphosphate synthase [Actinomycetota bacterium]
MAEARFGLGFDSHPADPGRPLTLGGVPFEGEPGLSGHSDGDVVCHAVADALLGAAALGDIGEHFPETDSSVAGISGFELLRRSAQLVRDAGLEPESCDAVLIAERPLVSPRRGEMRRRLAAAMGVGADSVSVKGTRPEGMGLTGDGAACMAIVLARRSDTVTSG